MVMMMMMTMSFMNFFVDVNVMRHVSITKTNFDNYVRGAELNAALNDMLGGGIFNSDGHA